MQDNGKVGVMGGNEITPTLAPLIFPDNKFKRYKNPDSHWLNGREPPVPASMLYTLEYALRNVKQGPCPLSPAVLDRQDLLAWDVSSSIARCGQNPRQSTARYPTSTAPTASKNIPADAWESSSIPAEARPALVDNSSRGGCQSMKVNG